MRRRSLVIAGALVAIAAIIALVIAWRWGARDHEVAGGDETTRQVRPLRSDPHSSPHGSIAGTVRDDRGQPIAGARVCAVLEDALDRPCVATDVRGAYRIADLEPGSYTLHASARTFLPGLTERVLVAGAHDTGIELVLVHGGVELRGTVSDVSGGPIARARVVVTAPRGDADADTDDAGHYVMWVPAGSTRVLAIADGYAPGSAYGGAPGTIDVRLVPESSIAGTVVDAQTGAPRADVVVRAEAAEPVDELRVATAVTDDAGRFQIARLRPGRYNLVAVAADGFGRSEGSLLAGLAQHVDGVIVKLKPAYRITARIDLDGTPCPGAAFTIRRDPSSDEIDGASHPLGETFVIDGVRPGRYAVRVRCPGALHGAAPPELVVDHADVTNVRWTVERGSTIRGRVRMRDGTPIADATVVASARSAIAIDAGTTLVARSDDHGAYAITGLAPARYAVEATAGNRVANAATVELASAELVQDLVVDPGGAITGVVVDTTGSPVAGLEIIADDGARVGQEPGYSDAAGAFTIAGIGSGDYVVMATRPGGIMLHDPGAADDSPAMARVHVTAPRTSTVRLVVEAEPLAIRGAVRDTVGAPIADAWVTAARESSEHPASTYWVPDADSVLAQTDGTFELRGLAPGRYTVRAYRKGGGDAIAEHVAAGSSVTLTLASPGSIAGTITLATGAPADELAIAVRGATGFRRHEHFYGTAGRYTIRDLPAGTFELEIEAPGGRGKTTATLAASQRLEHVDLRLQALVTLTGMLVERGTERPLAGIRMGVVPDDELVVARSIADAPRATTDARGRFELERVPAGTATLVGGPPIDQLFAGSRWTFMRTIAIPANAPPLYDLGKLPAVPSRVAPGAPIGKLGVRFTHDAGRITVAWIDPKGAAAKTELRVGDVVTAVDRVGVAAPDDGLFEALIAAPPGTTIELALASGNAVQIVLAP